jgi:thiamine biosynthesis lipoprotein
MKWMYHDITKPGFLIFLLAVLLPLNASADWQRQEAAIMGTAVTVELWHEDQSRGKALIGDIMKEMRRIDLLMSTFKPDSELSAVNTIAAHGPVTVSM